MKKVRGGYPVELQSVKDYTNSVETEQKSAE
jgi:hypothetical protein